MVGTSRPFSGRSLGLRCATGDRAGPWELGSFRPLRDRVRTRPGQAGAATIPGARTPTALRFDVLPTKAFCWVANAAYAAVRVANSDPTREE
ncbi:hypothetical protein GCM10009687_60860 [Asanoa iriomotensis]